MLGKIVFATMVLIALDQTRSFGRSALVPTADETQVSITAPPEIYFTVCPPSSCQDYAERFPACACDLKENLVRHAVVRRYLIPARLTRIDYIFRRW